MILFSHFVYRLLSEKTHYLGAVNRGLRQASLLQSSVERTRIDIGSEASLDVDSGAGVIPTQLRSGVASLCEANTPQSRSLRHPLPSRALMRSKAEAQLRGAELRRASAQLMPLPTLLMPISISPQSSALQHNRILGAAQASDSLPKHSSASSLQSLYCSSVTDQGSATSIGAFTQTSILRNPQEALRQIRNSETSNELFVVCKKKNIFHFIFFIFKRCEGIEACTSFTLKSVFMDSMPKRRFPGGRSSALQSQRDNSTSISFQININLISSYFLTENNLRITLSKITSNLLVWCKLCLELVSRQLGAAQQLSRKVIENPWLLLIFFIPYVIFFGYLCTNIFFQCGGDLFIYSILGSNGAEACGQICFGEALAQAPVKPTLSIMSQAWVSRSYALQSLHVARDRAGFALAKAFVLCENLAATLITNIIGTPSLMLATEFLRGAHYASKIFLVWSFFTIWKGIRPGQSSKNEYIIPLHINSKIKKRLRDLEGISKFLPLLETCIQSLKHQPQRPHKILAQVAQTLQRAATGKPMSAEQRRSLRCPQAEQSSAGLGNGLERNRGEADVRAGFAELSSAAELPPGPNVATNTFVQASPLRSSGTTTKTYSTSTQNLKAYPLGKYPKGYLFIGPPGTGKTLLAQAVAGEAGVPFIGLSASEIQKQISLGTKIGAVRLRNLFLQVKHHTPCILFFDEIDSIARRGPNFEHLHTSNIDSGKINTNGTSINSTSIRPPGDITLFTEFLIQMDGVQSGLVIIGTTNFLNHLDSAFIRSGRFDRILGLTYPGKNTRLDLLRLYTGNKGNYQVAEASSSLRSSTLRSVGFAALAPARSLRSALESTGIWLNKAQLERLNAYDSKNKSQQSSIDLMYFAEQTHGWTAADLATLVNESFLYLCHQKLLSEQAKHFCQIRSRFFRRLLSNFYQRKPKSLLVHTYKSLTEGMKKISTREKYFQGPKKK